MERMKWVFMVVLFFGFITVPAIAATEWWNAAKTENIVPHSEVLEAGPAIYVRLENGKLVEGGGYLRPSGTWRLVMLHNPFVRVLACSQTPGPRYEIWEEKVQFPGWKIFCFVKHYRFTTDIVGAWVDNGGGFKPLYLVYERVVFFDIDTGERFFGTYRLLYHSGADANKDTVINVLDLGIVAKYEDPSEPDKYVGIGHWADVNGDTVVNRTDLEIVANLFGAVPDMEATEAIPYIEDIAPATAPLLAKNRISHGKILLVWGKIKNE